MDMGYFKAADLTVPASIGRLPLTIGRLGRFMGFQPTVFTHAAQYGFITGHGSQVGLLDGHRFEVVIMQLNIPTGVIVVLRF